MDPRTNPPPSTEREVIALGAVRQGGGLVRRCGVVEVALGLEAAGVEMTGWVVIYGPGLYEIC
jgi:hypothetical protein